MEPARSRRSGSSANIHYVGTNELAAYLLTTPAGHILIDGGLPESAPLIEQSIRQLGFKVEDVKILLTTQAHFDHVGSMARAGQGLRRAGDGDGRRPGDRRARRQGRLPVRRQGDVPADKGGARPARRRAGDPRRHHADRACNAGPHARLHDVDDDGGRGRTAAAGGVSGQHDRESGHTAGHDESYPGIKADYEKTFATLASLQADVFLGAHAGFFDLAGKRERLERGEKPNPFIDPAGYQAWIASDEGPTSTSWSPKKTAAQSASVQTGHANYHGFDRRTPPSLHRAAEEAARRERQRRSRRRAPGWAPGRRIATACRSCRSASTS